MSKPTLKNCRGCGRDTSNKCGYCRVCLGGRVPEPEEPITVVPDPDEREAIEKLVEGDE